MDCSEAKSHLSAFASGLTNDLDRSEIEEHLTSCEECSLEVELLRGRASGQGSAPKPSDWTLEKIFGGEGGSDGAEASREPAAQPAAENEPRFPEDSKNEAPPSRAPAAPEAGPSLILPPPAQTESKTRPSDSKAAGAKSKSGSWDFEPADADKEAAPPEESLAFAEQALNRKLDGPGKSKAAAMRALIWGLGGVAGLGLLGVSVWMAMAVHQAPTRELSTGAARSTPAREEPAPREATSSDAPPTAPPPVRAIEARTLPAVPASPVVPVSARLGGTPSLAPAPIPSTPKPAPSAGAAAASTKATPASSKPSQDAATPKKVVSPAPAAVPATAPAAAPATATPAPGTTTSAPSARVTAPTAAPAKPAKRDDDDMWPTDDPVRAGTTGSGSSAAKPPATNSATTQEPPTAAAKPTGPATKPPETTDAAPPAAMRPIDRLHAATEKATTDRDLPSLRQLKTAWKALLRTTVGRDRSRTKREYADCIWAIQGLTGRDADRLECLNAYRDYLLSAPAGGTDTRSAERLREIEDALHESN